MYYLAWNLNGWILLSSSSADKTNPTTGEKSVVTGTSLRKKTQCGASSF